MAYKGSRLNSSGDLLTQALDISMANRIADAGESGPKGDFEGTVVGTWKRLDRTGAGVVEYKSKEYLTRATLCPSIFAVAPVEITYSNGTYFTRWTHGN